MNPEVMMKKSNSVLQDINSFDIEVSELGVSNSELSSATIYDENGLIYHFDVDRLELTSKQYNYSKRSAIRTARNVVGEEGLLNNLNFKDSYVKSIEEDIFSILLEKRYERMKKDYYFKIREYFSSVHPLINKIHRLTSEVKDLVDSGAKLNRQSPKYKKFKELRKDLDGCIYNQNTVKKYFNIFNNTGVYVYLEKAVNVSKSARGFYISAKCDSCSHESTQRLSSNGSYSSAKYNSNDRFDYFANEKKMRTKRKYVSNSLKYLDQMNYTHSFLTIPFKNVPFDKFDKTYFTDKKKGLNKVVKEFMRYKFTEADIIDVRKVSKRTLKTYSVDALNWQHLIGKRIEDVFKGYYGILEITYNEKMKSFHPHIHFICSRDKPKSRNDKITGVIPQAYLSFALENVCNKFGSDLIKGSKNIDIGARNVKNYYKNTQFNAVNYILQYVSKGIKVSNSEAFEKILFETNGIRFERAGGLLSTKNQSKYNSIMEFMFSLRANEDWHLSCSLSRVQDCIKFTWKEFKSYFGRNESLCPFCTRGKMMFSGVHQDEFHDDLTCPNVLDRCLKSLGVVQKIKY